MCCFNATLTVWLGLGTQLWLEKNHILVLLPQTWLEIVLMSHQKYIVLLPLTQLLLTILNSGILLGGHPAYLPCHHHPNLPYLWGFVEMYNADILFWSWDDPFGILLNKQTKQEKATNGLNLILTVSPQTHWLKVCIQWFSAKATVVKQCCWYFYS